METIINYTGLIIGIILAIVGIMLQVRSQRKKALYWSAHHTNLIKGYSAIFRDLKIQYRDDEIANLTVSKIVLWNSGNETIDSRDVAIPPYIYPRKDDTKILDVKVLKASTLGNQFRAEIKEMEKEMEKATIVLLDFDYLDGQQGAVIQVIHTGVYILPLMVGGQVKGVKHIEYKSRRPDLASQLPRVMLYFYAVTTFGLVGAYVYNSIFLGIPPRADWAVWLVGALWILVLVAIYFDIKQQRETAKIPKDLSVFQKDDIGLNKRQLEFD